MWQFDQHCVERISSINDITEDFLIGFCNKNAGESMMTRQKRLCLMRQFAIYLQRYGHKVSIPAPPEKVFKYPKRTPYIFSELELKRLFTQIDCWRGSNLSRGHREQMDPVIFRMVYGCGLRIMEALRLRNCNVDLKNGMLYILDSKNGRNRIVPMATSLTERCTIYLEKVQRHRDENDFFFQGLLPGHHISNESTYQRFREHLWRAGIPHTGKGPRIHDLRHTFCVHRLKYWVQSGADLAQVLPYLVAFLGHVDFRGTEYYLRMTTDLYPELISILEREHGFIIPKVGVFFEKP
jgi:integrase